jgi:hypothetical protein
LEDGREKGWREEIRSAGEEFLEGVEEIGIGHGFPTCQI